MVDFTLYTLIYFGIFLWVMIIQVKKMRDDMEEELKVMRTERRALEVHIERTKTWTENVGNWQVVIVDGTVSIIPSGNDNDFPVTLYSLY